MSDRPGCLVLGGCHDTYKPCCNSINSQDTATLTPSVQGHALDRSCSRYVTHFAIETSNYDCVINETVIRICCTFYGPSKSRSKLVWKVLRSEAFLFSFQFIALVLGVVKQMGETEDVYPTMHLAYCVVEIVITSMLIAIRTISLRMKLRKFHVHFDLLVKGNIFILFFM